MSSRVVGRVLTPSLRKRGLNVAQTVSAAVLLLPFTVAVATAACSSSSATSGAATDEAPTPPAPSSETTDGGDGDVARPLDACGAVRKSKCNPANEGSVVRGIVKFDPTHFAGKP